MTTITLPPELEEAVTQQARLRGITSEAVVVDALRASFGTEKPAEDGPASLDEWERLLGAADDHMVAARATDEGA